MRLDAELAALSRGIAAAAARSQIAGAAPAAGGAGVAAAIVERRAGAHGRIAVQRERHGVADGGGIAAGPAIDAGGGAAADPAQAPVARAVPPRLMIVAPLTCALSFSMKFAPFPEDEALPPAPPAPALPPAPPVPPVAKF